MRKRPITIALAAAGIVAAAHAAIAAVNNQSAEVGIAAPIAAPLRMEAQVPAETVVAVAKPEQPQALALAPAIEPANAKTTTLDKLINENAVRVSVTNPVASTTFPSAAPETAEPLPAVAAYFDRKNANTVLSGAAGPVFPSSAIEVGEPLPALVAYFDRIDDEQRLAAITARQRVTAYVDLLSQKLALALLAPTAANKSPVATTATSLASPSLGTASNR
jgi:hypothetical protein